MSGHRAAAALIGGLLLVMAAYHVLLTASTTASFAFHHPVHDQVRLNYRYLTVDFPASIFMLENGHRPIIPGLVRWMELRWLSGSQALQATTAWASAMIMVALIARVAWQGLSAFMMRAAAIAVAVTLLAWNSNARMFIHAYEAQHLFYITAAVVAGILAALRGCETGRWTWWTLAILFCLVATFSFGAGIAAFASIMAVAMIHRARWKVLAALAGAALATFAAYVWLLPGAEGVRNASSSFPLQAAFAFFFMRLGAVFAELTRLDFALPATSRVALAAGLLSIVPIAVSVVLRLRRREIFSSLETLGIALLAFGATVNAIMAVNRAGYFLTYPDQVFGDRYLYWSCVTWVGISLYFVARAETLGKAASSGAAILAGVLIAWCIPTALWLNGWATAAAAEVELSAIVLRLGARMDGQLEKTTDGPVQKAYLLADEMRSQGIGEFREAREIRLGSILRANPVKVPAIRASVGGSVMSASAPPLYRVSARLPAEIDLPELDSHFWIVDDAGEVVGGMAAAMPSSWPTGKARIGIPRRDQMEGYVTRSGGRLHLIRRSGGGAQAVVADVDLGKT